ncbi:GNAT family N-acetyltransferase [Devosia sp. A8/3-2]|nr:GNAT family N-acetyltransferase [Devosia sp. A8/3-2]
MIEEFKQALPATIATDRLLLTTPVLAHVPEMAVLANNKRIYRVLSRLPHPYDESHGRFFVETIARGPEEFAWSILRDGAYIGTIGLHLLPDRLPELGYWLGEPFWGQGYATEAAIAVVGAVKDTGIVSGLRSRALLDNAGSRKVLAKAGFVQTGEDVDSEGTLKGARSALVALEFTP